MKARVESNPNHLLAHKLLSGIVGSECRHCGKTFESDASLSNHLAAKGSKCFKTRAKRQNVVFPNEKKSVYGRSLLNCNTCFQAFKTVKERVKHELKEHKSV